jgi:hypothetical protein
LIRSGGEVARLIAQLRDDDPLSRKAAIARLRIIGARAVDSLSVVARSGASPSASLAALKALEGIDDQRVIEAVLPLAFDTDQRIARAAVKVLSNWVTRDPEMRVLDALTRIGLNSSGTGTVAIAALQALRQLPDELVEPVLDASGVRELLPPVTRRSHAPDVANARDLRDWLETQRNVPPLELHRLIVELRESAERAQTPDDRDRCVHARGVLHATLAAQGSKIAVYDLRETFELATGPLPLDYLNAVMTIGDASCLEPMARAWAAAREDEWWRTRLAAAAAHIMRLEKLTGRSAVVKRIRAKWPGFV